MSVIGSRESLSHHALGLRDATPSVVLCQILWNWRQNQMYRSQCNDFPALTDVDLVAWFVTASLPSSRRVESETGLTSTPPCHALRI